MADRNDELIAIRNHINQKAAETAIQQIAREAEANASNYYELAAAGRYDDAAYHLREAWRLDEEARKIAAAAQPQQQQSQYTAAERDLIRDYPQIANDPKKWNTALAAANNLVMRGYDRNSAEYVQAIAHACDVLNADLTESREVASPDEALRASQSEYGAVDVETYNDGVRRLMEMKKLGLYPMGQT
jgi:hypothetical protein